MIRRSSALETTVRYKFFWFRIRLFLLLFVAYLGVSREICFASDKTIELGKRYCRLFILHRLSAAFASYVCKCVRVCVWNEEMVAAPFLELYQRPLQKYVICFSHPHCCLCRLSSWLSRSPSDACSDGEDDELDITVQQEHQAYSELLKQQNICDKEIMIRRWHQGLIFFALS